MLESTWKIKQIVFVLRILCQCLEKMNYHKNCNQNKERISRGPHKCRSLYKFSICFGSLGNSSSYELNFPKEQLGQVLQLKVSRNKMSNLQFCSLEFSWEFRNTITNDTKETQIPGCWDCECTLSSQLLVRSAGNSSSLWWSWRVLSSAGEMTLSVKPGTSTLPELPPCNSVEVSQKDIIIITLNRPNDRPIETPTGKAPNLREHVSRPQLAPIFSSYILAMSSLADFKKIPLGLWEALHLFQHSGILKRGKFTVLSRFEFMCRERITPVA